MPVGNCCHRRVVTAEADVSVREVAQTMEREGVGTVIVTESANPVGILTDRDIALHVLINRLDPEAVQARDLMQNPLVTIPEQTSLGRAARILRMQAARRLPVVNEQGRPVGVIGSEDLVGVLSRELAALAKVVERQRPPAVSEAEATQTIDRSE